MRSIRLFRQRVLHWMVIVALIVTMVPLAPSTGQADSIYFQFRDFSTDSAAPTEVNSNLVEVAGSFYGVSASSITLRIEKLVGGQVVEAINIENKPIISGNSFLFPGITLYDGLNRIKVIGVNDLGNVVTGEAYVNFSNVPVITDIRLADGRILPSGSAIVTTRPNEAITVKAQNATEVTINGTQMIGGSGSSFTLGNIALKRGLNKLTIIARNATKTYELTRYLAYYNGSLTAFDVRIGSTLIDGNPTFSQILDGTVTGYVVVDANQSAPTLEVELVDVTDPDTPTTISTLSATATLETGLSGSGFSVYSFTTSGSLTVNSNGDYELRVRDTAGGTPVPTFVLPFRFRDANSPYITGIRQAYNVTVPSTANDPITFTSSASFMDNVTITQLPIWLVIDTNNFDASQTGNTTTVTASKNGVAVGSPAFSYSVFHTLDNKPAVRINSMPEGQVELTFKVTRGSASDSIKRTVVFIPVPSIQVDNIYNGQIFESNDEFQGTPITGKLVNFNLADTDELETVTVSLNGVQVQLGINNIDTDTGTFTFDAKAAGFALVPGPNELIFTGVANGVPVSTRLTVYLFSKDQPQITYMRPVPFVINPTADDPLDMRRKFTDSDLKFVVTDDYQYSTTETALDLLFEVKDFETLEVQMNGQVLARVIYDATNSQFQAQDDVPTDGIGLCFEDTNDNSCKASVPDNWGTYLLRLYQVQLPKSGMTHLTVIVRKGTVSVSQTVSIQRDLSPYIVLSPRLPHESVINSNFLKVSIKAEGADRVTIGKTDMVKGEGDIFRLELKDLKKGNNTIKFTVYQGNQKINGQFTVNYAADSSIGAQYKAKLPNSGKLSVFNGNLTLQFPKNTFLRQANRYPGQDVKTVDLFDAQELYFGIADRTDGRTVKKYNQVGEKDSLNNYLDGTITEIPVDSTAVSNLVPKANFIFASNLYWVDAGYFDQPADPSGDYKLIEALHPYQPDPNGDFSKFYDRAFLPDKWLEPSQRGTITIKYDENIVDSLARYLSVWRYTAYGWENIGGVVDTKKKTVTASFDGFGYYAVMALRYSFSDIIGHRYARNALETMYARGIMKNKDNNAFGVYDNITRAEFAQMLVKMLDVPLEYDPNNMTFDDVLPIDFPDALWNYRYVETAVRKGFIRGKSPRLFFPNDFLTREEAAVMIARALNLVKNNADMEKDKAALQKLFTDANQIDLYAASAVLAIHKAGYITGIPNTSLGGKTTYRFEPLSYLSRADAAVIVERVMKKMKKL